MKKVLYAFILLLCLAGGLGVGIIRQRAKAGTGDGVVMNTPVETPAEMTGEGSMEATPEETAMAEGEATPEETPMEVAAADPTPEPTPDESAAGRSFGGGSDPNPVKKGKRSSGGGGGGSSSASFASNVSSDPVPFNQEVDTSVGTVIEDPTPVPVRKGKKGKAVAEPTPEPVVASNDTVPFDSVDDLPTVDTGGDSGAADPFASSGNAASAAPTPDPFASSSQPTEVAMIAPQGSSELVFPAGSGGRASLKKVTQSKRGAETVVKIQINGTAPCKVTHLRASGTKPARVFVDFEDTELPGGSASPITGTAGPIKDISAKYFAGSAGIGTARIEISLTSGEKFPTVKPKGNFQASGTVEVVIGGSESF